MHPKDNQITMYGRFTVMMVLSFLVMFGFM
jgi:hypothetical protein